MKHATSKYVLHFTQKRALGVGDSAAVVTSDNMASLLPSTVVCLYSAIYSDFLRIGQPETTQNVESLLHFPAKKSDANTMPVPPICDFVRL